MISSLLVLFLVRTEALGRLDTQGRLDAGKRGNAKEDNGDKQENDDKQTGDECGREQLITCEDASRRWGWRGAWRWVFLAARASQNDEVARVGASNLLELIRKADLLQQRTNGCVPVSFFR